MLLVHTGQKARHILKGDQGDVERVAKADEARAFDGCLDVEDTSQHRWLVADHPNRMPTQPRKAHNEVLRVVAVDLEKVAVVHHPAYHLVHVVRLVRTVGNDRQKLLVTPIQWVRWRPLRWTVQIVPR